MYTFIRYKFFDEISDWMFMPKTIQDVIDFNTLYSMPICEHGFSNICKSIQETSKWKFDFKDNTKRFYFGDHPTSYYEQAFETMCHLPNGNKDTTNIFEVDASLYDKAIDDCI